MSSSGRPVSRKGHTGTSAVGIEPDPHPDQCGVGCGGAGLDADGNTLCLGHESPDETDDAHVDEGADTGGVSRSVGLQVSGPPGQWASGSVYARGLSL